MLKKFFLNMLSSFVGAWIALVLIIISGVMLVVAMMGNIALSSASQTEKVKSRSILKIDLEGMIEERESAMQPDLMTIMQGDLSAPQTLDVIVESISEAATNDNIVAIYLDCGAVAAGPATLDALRHALIEFKKTTDGKKKIIAYADSYSLGSYFIASVADEVYLNPDGALQMNGLSSSNFYFKGLLDKLGVKMQVVKVGTYKSAVEPYILTEMSAPARAQLDTMLNTMWTYMRKEIASARKGITPEAIDTFVSKDIISLQKSEFSMRKGLVDSLYYERQIQKRLADISGREIEKLNMVSPKTLVSQVPWSTAYGSKKQIAVLFACGEISDGNSNEINYEDLVPVIVKLADDENVKGLVLRVNSPGGSVFGSVQIGEALDYFQSKGKPLAVSMGDYAASGGYWISACADRIFADPLTVTGSIGIFGMIPNVSGTLEKLGVNVESVSTNPQANFPSMFKALDPVQLDAMQKYVDRGYDEFTSRVAKGRKMSKQKVYSIAEGRVWNAQTAVGLGLVDSLAYLKGAIDWTAAKAGISANYDIAAYPEVEPNFWSMVRSSGLNMAELKAAIETGNESVLKKYFADRILNRKPLQARMPEFRIVLQ